MALGPRLPGLWLALALVCACRPGGGQPEQPAADAGGSGEDGGPSPADGGTGGDAGPAADAGAPDANIGLPTHDVLTGLCRRDDGDVATPWPVARETLRCTSSSTLDAPDPLFPDAVTLPAATRALHDLCNRMEPTPGSREDLADPALAADLRAWLRAQVTTPPLQRALADLPDDVEARMDAVAAVWLPGNALEHVLCGDLNPNGRVGGLHLWSEWYLSEREGRANYRCSVDGLTDADVVAARYTWLPPQRTALADKPIGSFHVGMSPGCLLALGYHAVSAGLPAAVGSEATFSALVYGQPVAFSLALSGGTLISLFPVAQPDR